MDDQRDEEREDDEAFLDVWREWRRGRSREACEAKSPGCWRTARLHAPAWRGAISSVMTG